MDSKLKSDVKQMVQAQFEQAVDIITSSYEKIFDTLPAQLPEAQKEMIIKYITEDVGKTLKESFTSMDTIFSEKLNDSDYINSLAEMIKKGTNNE